MFLTRIFGKITFNHPIYPPKKEVQIYCVLKEEEEDDRIVLPKPNNRSKHIKTELIDTILLFKERSKECGNTMRRMIEMTFVPCDKQNTQRLTKRKKKDMPIIYDKWTQYGCPAYCTVSKMKSTRTNMEKFLGGSVCMKD